MVAWGYAILTIAGLMIMYQRWFLGFILFIFGISIILKGKKIEEKYGNKKKD
ncbi:hypothetical protein [Floricoccus penangensis]|uniref:hypothetical protein n=1 Tax=Floricoccus penangensis TaxID=1859475 RepID=UPI0013014874|nr:hypothetical protein [Floricoccus penangensis]